MTNSGSLRAQLDDGWVFAAGCFDALSAALAREAGFKALHLTGMGVEATQIGGPDIGLTTMTELASHVARIAAAVNIQMIVDVDTGFGGIDNVMRTIRELERAGAGGIHIEDQVFPKKCPLLEGRRIVPEDEAIGRVKAALAARSDPDFVVVARSDADEISFEEVVRRSNLFLAAGADVAMPMMMRMHGQLFRDLPPDEQMSWLRRLPAEIDGPVLTMNIPPGYTVDHMREAGFSVVILPVLSLGAAATAMARVLREAFVNGTAAEYFKANPLEVTTMDIFKMFGLDQYLEDERRFGGSENQFPVS
jgi:2-methylisocitrate lyase-like PEP mutase family enzyme